MNNSVSPLSVNILTISRMNENEGIKGYLWSIMESPLTGHRDCVTFSLEGMHWRCTTFNFQVCNEQRTAVTGVKHQSWIEATTTSGWTVRKQEKQELSHFCTLFLRFLYTFLAMAKPSHSVAYRKVDVDAIETYNPDDDPTLAEDGVTGPNEGEVTGLLNTYPCLAKFRQSCLLSNKQVHSYCYRLVPKMPHFFKCPNSESEDEKLSVLG